jgi:hypothetical protein
MEPGRTAVWLVCDRGQHRQVLEEHSGGPFFDHRNCRRSSAPASKIHSEGRGYEISNLLRRHDLAHRFREADPQYR